ALLQGVDDVAHRLSNHRLAMDAKSSHGCRKTSEDIFDRTAKQLLANGLTEEQIAKHFEQAVIRALPEMGALLLNELKKTAKRHLKDCSKDRRGFLRRLRDTWGSSFRLFRILIEAAREAGSNYNNDYRPNALKNNDLVFEALCRLHARA